MRLILNKRGPAECAKRLNLPTTLETACQTDHRVAPETSICLLLFLFLLFHNSSTSLSICFQKKSRSVRPLISFAFEFCTPLFILSPGPAHSAGPPKRSPVPLLKLVKKSTHFRSHFLLNVGLIFELKFGPKTVICWFRSLLCTHFLNLPVLQPPPSWKRLLFLRKTMVFAYPGHLAPGLF